MGTIFEELIRKFNEALNENPGEHFTPATSCISWWISCWPATRSEMRGAGDPHRLRPVLRLRRHAHDHQGAHHQGRLRKNGDLLRPAINPDAEIHLFGQEVNPETWAVSKSDLFMKDPTGRDAENIAFGSTLSERPPRRHAVRLPDRQPALREGLEARRGRRARPSTRAAPRAVSAWDCRASATASSSSCCTCCAREGSEGRRLAHRDHHERLAALHRRCRQRRERDPPLHPRERLLEALIALPEQLFYNTGIATYVWVVTNRKAQLIDARCGKGKVSEANQQLIDATSFWVPMRKSLGGQAARDPTKKA
jgi:type I restriction enzyme M protein